MVMVMLNVHLEKMLNGKVKPIHKVIPIVMMQVYQITLVLQNYVTHNLMIVSIQQIQTITIPITPINLIVMVVCVHLMIVQ